MGGRVLPGLQGRLPTRRSLVTPSFSRMTPESRISRISNPWTHSPSRTSRTSPPVSSSRRARRLSALGCQMVFSTTRSGARGASSTAAVCRGASDFVSRGGDGRTGEGVEEGAFATADGGTSVAFKAIGAKASGTRGEGTPVGRSAWARGGLCDGGGREATRSRRGGVEDSCITRAVGLCFSKRGAPPGGSAEVGIAAPNGTL